MASQLAMEGQIDYDKTFVSAAASAASDFQILAVAMANGSPYVKAGLELLGTFIGAFAGSESEREPVLSGTKKVVVESCTKGQTGMCSASAR